MTENPPRKRAPGHGGRKRKGDEVRQTKTFRLPPDVLAMLPAANQSEWVEAAIRAYKTAPHTPLERSSPG